MVLRESDVVEGGEFRAQKRCGSKPLSTTPKSHAHLASNPIAAHGHPLVVKLHPDPKVKSVNDQGLVVETLGHFIIEGMGVLVVET
jgi:hypothetical protein